MKRTKALPLSENDYERAAEEYLRNLPLEHFMEATPQSTQRKITLESFDLLHLQCPDIQIFNELLVQYPLDDGLGQVVPDNMVVRCGNTVTAGGSFNLPFEPARPVLVMEYVSAYSQRKDYKESFQKYEEELRVPYCIFFYPERQDLRIYRHGGRKYRLLKPNAAGRFPIRELDLEVALLDGWVRFWYKGKLLDLPADLQRKIEAESQRAEQEKQRAEQEKQRAEQEKQRADAAESEVRRLRALLEPARKVRKNGEK